ncbi:unnamed protein product [Pocillopora meandrina]|uniref:Apextrin C-terminal domain-containing protein n=1 Tax=Pocillopora meandrina TaxID=46732 RepID=A0AAU9WZJ1_9CNID|nr:unnamed protein product [Pocillopora meandrina]
MKLVLFIVVVIICFFAHSISAHGNGIPQCLPALAAYLHGQEASLQIVKNDLQKTKQQLQQAIGKWPPGHYCILAKGPCPAGFFRSSGYMRALKIYAASNTYITPVTFGDSKITCHGPCGKYGQWIGELYITACCK